MDQIWRVANSHLRYCFYDLCKLTIEKGTIYCNVLLLTLLLLANPPPSPLARAAAWRMITPQITLFSSYPSNYTRVGHSDIICTVVPRKYIPPCWKCQGKCLYQKQTRNSARACERSSRKNCLRLWKDM